MFLPFYPHASFYRSPAGCHLVAQLVGLRRFPFRSGRLRQKLCKEIVAFPTMSNTGDSTVSCGLPHVRLDWASDNQSSPYTTSLIGLWPLILGLHRPSFQHATVPSTLSSEGQLLVYPPRFSGLTPTGERDSCATWAHYYECSVTLRLAPFSSSHRLTFTPVRL